MQKDDFIRKLKEELELQHDNLKETTNLKQIEGFDSMSIMGIISFVDEHFSKRLTAQQLAGITTLRSLMELIGMEHFAK
jgi:acyl carrier protein